MTEDERARLALRVNQANIAMGAESFRAEGALFCRDLRYPAVRDANHVTEVTASTPVEIDALFERAERDTSACRPLLRLRLHDAAGARGAARARGLRAGRCVAVRWRVSCAPGSAGR
jgi:hypothetical protein